MYTFFVTSDDLKWTFVVIESAILFPLIKYIDHLFLVTNDPLWNSLSVKNRNSLDLFWFMEYFFILTKSLSGKYVFAAGKAAKTHTNVAMNCTETKTDVIMSCDLEMDISLLKFS